MAPTPNSTPRLSEPNPYADPLHQLLPLLALPPNHPSPLTPLTAFIGRLQPSFRSLILTRDTNALLIFAYWLALMARVGSWWIVCRARMECGAIVQYLERRREEEGEGDWRVGELVGLIPGGVTVSTEGE